MALVTWPARVQRPRRAARGKARLARGPRRCRLAGDRHARRGEAPADFARLVTRGRSALLVTTPPARVAADLDHDRHRPAARGPRRARLHARQRGRRPGTGIVRGAAGRGAVEHLLGRGRSVAVVGWWATAPAEHVRGTLVSDRVAPQLLRVTRPPDADAVSPPAAWAALAGDVVRADALTRDDLARYVPLSAAEFEARGAPSRPRPRRRSTPTVSRIWPRSWPARARTRPWANACSRPASPISRRSTSKASTPSRTCSCARRTARRRSPRPTPTPTRCWRGSPRGRARHAGGGVLGPRLPPAGRRHHGRSRPARGAGHGLASAYGILAVAEARELLGTAGSAAPGASGTRPRATPLDIAPTVLHAAGLPAGREMPGTCCTSCCQPT